RAALLQQGLPAGRGGHSKAAGRQRLGAGGAQRRASLADELEEDEAEHDVLVLGGVHVVAQAIGGLPQGGLEAELAATSRLGAAARRRRRSACWRGGGRSRSAWRGRRRPRWPVADEEHLVVDDGLAVAGLQQAVDERRGVTLGQRLLEELEDPAQLEQREALEEAAEIVVPGGAQEVDQAGTAKPRRLFELHDH